MIVFVIVKEAGLFAVLIGDVFCGFEGHGRYKGV